MNHVVMTDEHKSHEDSNFREKKSDLCKRSGKKVK